MRHTEFKQRFLPLQQILFREAYRMLGDSFEAEDALQNLYMHLWEHRDELENLVTQEAYCRKILKNICIDRWRSIKAHEVLNMLPDEWRAILRPTLSIGR